MNYDSLCEDLSYPKSQTSNHIHLAIAFVYDNFVISLIQGGHYF